MLFVPRLVLNKVNLGILNDYSHCPLWPSSNIHGKNICIEGGLNDMGDIFVLWTFPQSGIISSEQILQMPTTKANKKDMEYIPLSETQFLPRLKPVPITTAYIWALWSRITHLSFPRHVIEITDGGNRQKTAASELNLILAVGPQGHHILVLQVGHCLPFEALKLESSCKQQADAYL